MKISFILVEPARPGNIGSATRAIKTMGFSSLRLVNPCDHLSEDARKLAYGSHDVLKASKLYTSLADAIEDLDLVVATTAKKRTVWNDYPTPKKCSEIIKAKGNTIHHIGIVFGREESGLTAAELELCDIRSTIPLAAAYPSVNLAQSVMIYAYEFSEIQEYPVGESESDLDEREQKVLKRKAGAMLQQLDIIKNANLSRRMMERLMLAGKDDIHLFLSFHQFLQRYLDKD